MKKQLHDIVKRLGTLRSDEAADRISDEQFLNGLSDIQDELNGLASDKPKKAPKPTKKKFKTGCPNCGARDNITVHSVEESSADAEYNAKNVLVVPAELDLNDFYYTSAYCNNCHTDIEPFEAVTAGDEDEGEDG